MSPPRRASRSTPVNGGTRRVRRRPGKDDGFAGAADHELIGVLCAWDRIEAHAAARKLAAVAELIR